MFRGKLGGCGEDHERNLDPPTGGALGADVHGVDLSKPVSKAAFRHIAEAWSEHLVLRFAGQRIDDQC